MNRIIAEDLDFILSSDVPWEKLRGKNVLVTGAYGTLLSYVVYTLLWLNEKRNLDIMLTVLVRSSKKAKKVFGQFRDGKNLILYMHDLSTPAEICYDLDYIIHGASYADPEHFAKDPSGVIVPNAIGTYHLLELARAKSVKGFLYFSSGAVYGIPLPGMGEEVSEDYWGWLDPLDPMNCYGESKRAAENMCRVWHKQYGVPTKIVRHTHGYGPSMDIERDVRTGARFVKCIVDGRDIVLANQGVGKRSFTYIADSTVAFFKVLLEAPGGEAYNVGNDKAYISIREFAEIAVSAFPEKKLQVITNSPSGLTTSQEYQMFMTSKKLQRLGWKCAFGPREGIRRTVQSFLE